MFYCLEVTPDNSFFLYFSTHCSESGMMSGATQGSGMGRFECIIYLHVIAQMETLQSKNHLARKT